MEVFGKNRSEIFSGMDTILMISQHYQALEAKMD